MVPPSGPPLDDAVAMATGVWSRGEVVSLTIQLSAAGATAGAGDAAGPGGGAISRESFSRHSTRSAGASREQARSFSIASLAPCAPAPARATPNATDTQDVARLVVSPAAFAPVGPAALAP